MKKPSLRIGSSGQILVGVVVALLLIAIFVPMIVNYVREEARWSTKQKRTTSAFHLAEAAVDRGIWKLTESDENWEDAKDGDDITGYNNDVEYTDVSGGLYKIFFSSGPASGEVTVLGTGRDTSTKEVRAVQAIYTKASINAGLQVEGGMDYRPNMHVHWGPVVNYTSINQTPGDYYPRKYSKGQISGRDTVNDSVNTDNLEYWAFNTDLGTPPQVDLDEYKTLAKASVVPVDNGVGQITQIKTGSPLAIADPVGSGYFSLLTGGANSGASGLRFDDKTGGGNNVAPNAYYFQSSTSVIYVDATSGESQMSSKCFLQANAIIFAGHDLDCNADDFDNFSATVPATAASEYLHGSLSSYTWPGKTTPGPGNCCYDVDNLAGHGFLYVGKDMKNSAGGMYWVGVIDVIGTISMNTITIFYDATVASGIKLKAGSPRRISWKEVKTTW